MNVQFLEPLTKAWNRMKAALLKPFDIHKWFVVGFNAFLAGMMEASNGGGGARWSKDWDRATFGEVLMFPQTAWNWLMDHPAWAAAILFAVLVAAAVIIVLTWVSSRGVFMFMDNVVRDKAEIAKPWRDYQKEGNSLFVWRLLLGIVSFAAFGLLAAYFFIRGAALYESGAAPGLPIMFFIGLGLVALAVILVWGYIVLFLREFVAALMYKNRVSCVQAWRLFLGLFRRYPFQFIGFGIVVFLLMIAFAVAVIIAGLITCCVGWLILVIPYIGTVATLPFWYALRAFSLEFLAQFGPEYDVFPRPAAAAAPAAPAA